MTIRVLVCDDEGLVRAGLATILEHDPGIEVVGEAADGVEAVTMGRRLRPDVALMDIRMPGLDGITATRQLTAPGPHAPVRVLVLTTHDLDEYVYEALRAGASGFLVKGASPADLRQGIRVVAEGQALLAPTATRRLIDTFLPRRSGPAAQPAAQPAADLTPRERQVLVLLAQGLSNAEIGAMLAISSDTVKTHVSRLLMKLGVRDRVQAVVHAYQSGIVSP